MRRITRTTTLGAALLAATLLLAGCSAGGGSVSDESGGAPVAPEVNGGDAVTDGDSGDFSSDETARDVIVTGSMTVTADDPIAASRDAVDLVEAAGGRVDGRTEYAPSNGDAGSATLVLRIPAERLQEVIDDLAELGRADEISTSTNDVTQYVTDLESRIATQRNIIDRLNAMFAQATTIADLITLETTIAEHQATLEDLQTQQRSLDDQIALSTISLYLRSEAEAPAQEPMDFLSGLAAGWGAFVAFFSGLLVALGVLLPWLIAAALISGAIVLLVRWNRRRRAGQPTS
ncbi:DUF4349 domain-containing protein [Pseudolysinimonas yzui]|uniref:DUF4349 domain-containing protein n=1 Tax=Pseudolysinimonas yzui TaxID=2708254 RepID=A0A8J3GSI1_9MICO|nr:DUF4349 domain-containing protein [Pseudolysinimonas yzui]GHF23460.1 hypothetical protein GCM10011600_25720 [Pseudolysinimonas yzui]